MIGTTPGFLSVGADGADALVAGRYRILRKLAAGGMGKVYLARQEPLGRLVAIKVISAREDAGGWDPEELRRRFLLEASACAQLDQRNVVVVHDYGELEGGQLYMAMEFLDGKTLSSLLKGGKRMPAVRACRIAIQVARALRAAHDKGLVHRDLKPGNIMILEDPDEDEDGGDFVKVLDFGVVKVFQTEGSAPMDEDLTRGAVIGSPKYMAPEQALNTDVGPHSDVYALGAVLFTMLVGRAPFTGSTSPEILEPEREGRDRLDRRLAWEDAVRGGAARAPQD